MDLRTYLGALRKNWWIIGVAVFVFVLAGLGAYRTTPATYASTVTFYVSTPVVNGSSPQSSGQFAVTRVNSYVELLSSDKLASAVIKQADLDLPPRTVASMITGTAQLNTVLVTATVTGTSEDLVLKVSDGVAKTFGAMVDDLDNQGGGAGNDVVDINVVTGPSTPLAVSPSLKLYGGGGLLAGLLIGVIVALLRELLNTTIRSVDAVNALVPEPVVGSIYFDSVAKRSPVILGDQTTSARAESYRQLRTSLQFIDAAETADVLLITSAVPGEGKTVTAVNLALTFAELGERVLLIGADLRRPKCGDYLGLQEGLGLTNVLLGQVEVKDAIQPWGDRAMFYLASGSVPPNPSELLGGKRMSELMDVLRDDYDRIILDAPPLLPVTDAAVASGVVDGVLLVVRHGRTTRGQLVEARRSLDAVGARVLGVVLNMRRASRREKRSYGRDSYLVDPQTAESSASAWTMPSTRGSED